jgi:glycosyltransferase 2 family protein
MAATRIANPVADGLGGLLLAGVAAYVAACALLKRPLSGFGHSVTLPSARLAVLQLSVGALDNAVAASILWILLPAGSAGYLSFVGAYAPSVVAGLVSHVPGGVGVFEGSLSTLLAQIPPAPLAAAFLGYRLAFFVVPLLVASACLLLDGLTHRAKG